MPPKKSKGEAAYVSPRLRRLGSLTELSEGLPSEASEGDDDPDGNDPLGRRRRPGAYRKDGRSNAIH